MEKVVIVMPTFNEAENIGPMIEELVGKEFAKITNADMHLLVVDANSPDGTAKVVQEKQRKFKRLHLLVKKKAGLGADYIAGFKYAMSKLKADAVMEMDADGQHPPRFVKPMVEAYLNGADYVIGSRYITGGSIPKECAFFRKFVSFTGNLFIRLVLLKPRLHDLTTGFRLTKVKGVLDQIDLDSIMEPKRFAYKVDLLYQSVKNAKNVKEVPLEFVPRTKDKAKFLKFATVGFIGYLVNASTLLLFTKRQFPGPLAWGFSTELAIINNFIFNNIWTFKSEKITGLQKLMYKFLQFNMTSAGALVIQIVFGSLSDILFGVAYRQLALPFIILFLVLPYNYFMYNMVIWKSWKLRGAKKINNPIP